MAGGRQFRPHLGALFLEHFQDAFPAVPFGRCEDLLYKADRLAKVLMQRLAVDFRHHSVIGRIAVSGIDADGRSYAARIDVDLPVQFRVTVALCIQDTQQCFVNAEVGEELLRQVRDIKHKSQIVNSRRMERVCDQRRFSLLSVAARESRLLDAVDKRPDLPGEVLSAEHGDLFQILPGTGGLLPFAERCQFIDDLLPLFSCQSLCELVQLLPELLRDLLCKAFFRRHHDDRFVRVVQKVFSDQLFKISLAHLFPELRERFAELQINEGRHIVVEPCIEGVEAVYKSLGIIAVVGFSVFEFEVVDAREERPLVKALVRDLPQRLLDRFDKLLFALGICVLGRHRIGGLADAEFKKGIHILADALVPERFFDRGAFGVAEHVIEDLEGKTKFRVLSVLVQ